MPDHDPTPRSGLLGAQGSRRSSVAPPSAGRGPGTGPAGEPADPPTVRSGSAAPTGAISARGSNPPRTPGLGLPEPGERVDVFALEESIGAGGMGAVYKAADIKLDRYVALKILPPDQAVDPEVVQRYYQEGRAAARLDHENIARVFTIGFDGRYHFIAFEYVEGTTIRQVVEERGPFAAEGAIHLTLQIAGALVHAAARGVVHRDIKPSNIIVTPQGRAKLVDMGLARRFERADETELTRSGMTLGTFDYISPEQALDPRNVDIRSDLYSLGCTLFHMLSGQPPFPEGTLAQKLLNHQKDAPPDIRQLNPAVPDGLAAILVKLMAKDRDRRYQSPEQVARDLLTLAGSLGLRLDAPDTVAWTPPAARPAWERHLAWAVPVAAFVLVLLGLYWMGDGPVQVVLPPEIDRPPIAKTRPNPVPPNPRPPVREPETPRDLAVRSSDDLIRALANAPRRSTIFLVESGPYVIKPAAARKLAGVDLTIKAEEGVRPVLRLADPAPGEPDAEPRAILDLAGGRLQVEGVTFLVESENAVAIRAEDNDLAVRRCQFLRTGARARPVSRPAAILARGGARANAAGERGGSVAADASYFAPGQAAVLASGPVQVNARDCVIAPSPSDLACFWFDNPGSAAAPAAIRLAHVSVLAEAGPVFRFTGTQPHVQVARSVIGSPGSTPASLVLIDDPDRLDWWGEDNVFARIGFYLQPTDPASDEAPVRSFADWADSPRSFREAGSIPLDRSPWDDPDPVSALARRGDDLGRGLGLSLPAREVALKVGARQGPTGTIPAPTIAPTAVAAAPPRAAATTPPPAPARPVEDEPAPPPAALAPMPMPMPARDPEVDEGAAMVPMPTMPTTPRRTSLDGGPGDPADEPVRVEPELPRPPLTQVGPPMAAAAPEPRPDWMGTPASRPAEAGPVIRTPVEFLQALNRPSTQPVRTLTVAADADWSLPAIRLAPGSLVVRAQPGATRPRLRFRPDADQIAGAWDWPAFLTIPSGVVRLEGIDLLLAAEDAPMPGRWAAFEVRSGSAQLELVGCSVTIEGVEARSALVVVAAAESPSATAPDPAEPALMSVARVRLQDGWFRVGGDLVDVAPGVRLDLGLDGVAAATAGALLREHGSPEGKPAGLTQLEITRSTVRSPGHLVRVETTPEAPEIPAVEVAARNAVFATDDADTALIRVTGQDDAGRWADRVRWKGEGVGYHRVGVLRLDEEGPARMVARRLARSAWDRAPEVSDRGGFHGDLRFSREWTPDRRAWHLGRDDFQLRSDSPVGQAGVDPRRLPGPANP